MARNEFGVLSQISIATDSCGIPLVEGEHATESFASADAADGRGRIAGGEGDDVVQALVVGNRPAGTVVTARSGRDRAGTMAHGQ